MLIGKSRVVFTSSTHGCSGSGILHFSVHRVQRDGQRWIHATSYNRGEGVYTASLLKRPRKGKRKARALRRRQRNTVRSGSSMASAAEGYHGYLSDGDLQLRRFDYNYWIRDVLLTNIGIPGFTFLAYASDDIMKMRQYFFLGSACNIAMLIMHRNMQSKAPVFWALVFALFNGYNILKLRHERKDVALDEESVEIYEKGFQAHGFTPRQFARILRHAQWKDFFEDELIVKENSPVNDIVFVVEGEVDLTMSGNRVAGLGKGSFVTSLAALLPKETRSRLQSVSSELLGHRTLSTPGSNVHTASFHGTTTVSTEQKGLISSSPATETGDDDFTQQDSTHANEQSLRNTQITLDTEASGEPATNDQNQSDSDNGQGKSEINVLDQPEEDSKNKLAFLEVRTRAEAVGLRVREAIMRGRNQDPHVAEDNYRNHNMMMEDSEVTERQNSVSDTEKPAVEPGSDSSLESKSVAISADQYRVDLAPKLAADVASTGIASLAGRNLARNVLPEKHMIAQVEANGDDARKNYVNFTSTEDEEGIVKNTASARVASPRSRVLVIPVSAIKGELAKDRTLEKPILSLAAGETAARLLLLQATAQKVYVYRKKLKAAIQSPPYGVLSDEDKQQLASFCEKHSLSHRQHREALAMLGWNEKDWERGYKGADWKTTQARYVRDTSEALMKLGRGTANAIGSFFRLGNSSDSQESEGTSSGHDEEYAYKLLNRSGSGVGATPIEYDDEDIGKRS